MRRPGPDGPGLLVLLIMECGINSGNFVQTIRETFWYESNGVDDGGKLARSARSKLAG